MTTWAWLSNFEAAALKDEQWVVNEIAVGWQTLQKAEQTVAVDVQNIFAWLQAHHADILALFQGVLSGAAAIGSLLPQTAPAVSVATTAIDAATAAIDQLSKGITAGTTPLSTITNAYHVVKDAQTAVNNVLKVATAKPVAKAA